MNRTKQMQKKTMIAAATFTLAVLLASIPPGEGSRFPRGSHATFKPKSSESP
ncbi:hypothetical protein [Fontibacillus sp. BL9]|uniref:hypothetical protein n=1 Tax=Fontibacillus sp. BL9 TaxID=3389971 RepID=UPI00397D877A